MEINYMGSEPHSRDVNFRERTRKEKIPEKASTGFGQHPKEREKRKREKLYLIQRGE